MKTALIGYSGFVGSNLANQFHFGDLYNSKNIQKIAGNKYDLVVCAGARAEKWKINQEPAKDLANIKMLASCLKRSEIKKFVLISTIDVYPLPVGVDEDALFNPKKSSPYGYNRWWLEQFCTNNFDTLVIRLPGLFGSGLKKNVIYDFLNDNQTEKIHCENVFQFYFVARLWKDILKILKTKIELINFATEPTSVREIAKKCFGFPFDNKPIDIKPALYDFRSKHYEIFGGPKGYLYDKRFVLRDLKGFVHNYKKQL